MYLRCSMQYYFRYVLGLKERPKLYMSNGSAGHTALELNSKNKIATGADQKLEEILQNYHDAFDKEIKDFEKSDFKPDDDPGTTKNVTDQILTVYRHRIAPDIRPIAVELDFTVPLPATEDFEFETKPMQGKIDLVASRGRIMQPNAKPMDRKGVFDNKFPQRLPSNLQDLADINDQTTVYDMALTMAGAPPDDLGFIHFVPPTKTIASRIITTYRSAELMKPENRLRRHQRLLYKIRTTARAIAHGIFIPTDDPRICAGCGFRDRCQFSLVKNDYDALMIRQKGAE